MDRASAGAGRLKPECTERGVQTYLWAMPALNMPALNMYAMKEGAEKALDNGQPFPSLNTMDKPATEADGSTDIYFGPTSPSEGKPWLKTIRGKGFFVIFPPLWPDQGVLRPDVETRRYHEVHLTPYRLCLHDRYAESPAC